MAQGVGKDDSDTPAASTDSLPYSGSYSIFYSRHSLFQCPQRVQQQPTCPDIQPGRATTNSSDSLSELLLGHGHPNATRLHTGRTMVSLTIYKKRKAEFVPAPSFTQHFNCPF